MGEMKKTGWLLKAARAAACYQWVGVLILAAAWIFFRPILAPIFLLLPLLWGAACWTEGHFFPRTRLDIPILLLAALTLMSIFVTPNLENSLPKVLGVVVGIGGYYAMVDAGRRSERHAAWVVWAFVGAGASVACLGLFGAAWFTKFPALTQIASHLPRTLARFADTGEGFQPNAITGTLTVVFPLTLWLVISWRRPWGQAWADAAAPLPGWLVWGVAAAAAFLQVVWLLLSQARGALLGILAGLVTLAFWQLWPRKRWAGWAAASLLVAAGYFLWFQAVQYDLEQVAGTTLVSTLEYRWEIWRWGWQVWQDFPLTGLGYNTFRLAAPVLYPVPVMSGLDVAHTHNAWLDAGVTMGVGGAVVYFWLWMRNLIPLCGLPVSLETWQAYAGQALAAGWVAWFAFSLADTIPLGSKLGTLLWMALAVGQIVLPQETTA